LIRLGWSEGVTLYRPNSGVVIARAVAAAKSGADTQQCPTELGSETASL
jgi:hypothetical protein